MKDSSGQMISRTAVTKCQAITDSMRTMILNGEAAPGALLPTIRELAERFDTSLFTVQAALTPLEVEGLIERRRRTGTIVKYHPAVLTCAGIYAASLLHERERAFYRELTRQLQEQLGGQQVQSRIFVDTRPPAACVDPMPELIRAIESRRIQGLFVVLTDQDHNPWLTRLPVAASFVSSDPILNRVSTEAEQFLRLGLTRLRERGCRTVGLIAAVHIHRDHHHPNFQMYESFTNIVVELGLTVRDPWVITPAEHRGDIEAYGYEAFRRLWAADAHPDGLLVFPDISARGVMTAALELGVRVPDDIQMVFHHNTGVDWTCPLGVDWVETDVAAWAAAMIDQVRRQKAGEEIQEPTVLGYRLVEG
jgi:DNA-binding LacI/PurR family transcriptional regulator